MKKLRSWMAASREIVIFLERPICLLGILLIFLGLSLNVDWLMALGIWFVFVYFIITRLPREKEKSHDT